MNTAEIQSSIDAIVSISTATLLLAEEQLLLRPLTPRPMTLLEYSLGVSITKGYELIKELISATHLDRVSLAIAITVECRVIRSKVDTLTSIPQ